MLFIYKSLFFILFNALGEKSFWAMMNRPAPGFDAEEYKQRLTAIDVAELAKEMSVDKIEYPCILVGFGSAVVIYLVSRLPNNCFEMLRSTPR